MNTEELDILINKYYKEKKEQAIEKLREIYEPKLKADFTVFDEFAFEEDMRKE